MYCPGSIQVRYGMDAHASRVFVWGLWTLARNNTVLDLQYRGFLDVRRDWVLLARRYLIVDQECAGSTMILYTSLVYRGRLGLVFDS